MGKHTNNHKHNQCKNKPKVKNIHQLKRKAIFWTTPLIQKFDQRSTNYTIAYYMKLQYKYRSIRIADPSDNLKIVANSVLSGAIQSGLPTGVTDPSLLTIFQSDLLRGNPIMQSWLCNILSTFDNEKALYEEVKGRDKELGFTKATTTRNDQVNNNMEDEAKVLSSEVANIQLDDKTRQTKMEELIILKEYLKLHRMRAGDHIFQEVNTQNRQSDKEMVEYIDLHGQLLADAERIFKEKTNQVQLLVSSGQLKPNCGKEGHVIKFICGAGKHGKGIMKEKLLTLAKDDMGYEAYMNKEKGNVLVRLQHLEKKQEEDKIQENNE